MQQTYPDLAHDWVNFAKASLQTRIDYTAESTAKVLAAIQAISAELEDKTDIEPLINLKAEESTSSEVLTTLKGVLDRLDEHDTLAQLIYPLFSALQFEDRTRQQLESIMGMLTTWSEVITEDLISDAELSQRLMKDVISIEQQTILSRYFPEHISSKDAIPNLQSSDEIDLF